MEKLIGYMGQDPDSKSSKIALFGVPMDITSSWRPGSRMAPGRIREVSWALEEYSPASSLELGGAGFCDLGDVKIPIGNLEESLRAICREVSSILREGRIPIAMGGEHLVTLPIIEAVREAYGEDLAVIHLDAHADLRDEYLGQRLSHATVMRRVCEIVSSRNIYQIGIRSGTREEFEFARENTHLMEGNLPQTMARALESIGSRHIYVSLDIDVVDPAFAPGTGTPEPGGATSRELLEAIHLLKGMDIVGFDLVEVNPQYDHSDITSLLAAKVLREMILILSRIHRPA